MKTKTLCFTITKRKDNLAIVPYFHVIQIITTKALDFGSYNVFQSRSTPLNYLISFEVTKMKIFSPTP